LCDELREEIGTPVDHDGQKGGENNVRNEMSRCSRCIFVLHADLQLGPEGDMEEIGAEGMMEDPPAAALLCRSHT
jgi:hypothetical protein